MLEPLFPLGRVVMTTNLQGQLQEADPAGWEREMQGLIRRHVSGDWGDLDQHDRRENQVALEKGFRIFSAYNTGTGIRLYIITEADRSCTTCLLPADY